MARSIPRYLSGIVEELELERPELVTVDCIASLAANQGVTISAPLIAARLKEKGWLLQTPQRGVWEFAPAEVAGPYSSLDPLLPIKAFALANPTVDYALTFQTAAWALGLSDRVPSRIEIAFTDQPKVKVPEEISKIVFKSNLSYTKHKGVYILAPEAIIVCLTNRPSTVRSWSSIEEWLPEVAYEITSESMIEELHGRARSTWARTGYLLQSMRPDIAEAIRRVFIPKTKVKFGRSSQAIRNDEAWQVSDAVLPFDPREMGSIK